MLMRVSLKNPLEKIRQRKASMQHDSLVKHYIGKSFSHYESKFLLYTVCKWKVHGNLTPQS